MRVLSYFVVVPVLGLYLSIGYAENPSLQAKDAEFVSMEHFNAYIHIPPIENYSLNDPLSQQATEGQAALKTNLSGNTNPIQKGLASWYGNKFHGRKTASGKKFNMYELSVAHPSLPFNSWVKITHVETGQSVFAQVTDRGPYVKGRIIDLSKATAQAIGLLPKGVGLVEIQALPNQPQSSDKTGSEESSND
jgi:rare lipoprotein A